MKELLERASSVALRISELKKQIEEAENELGRARFDNVFAKSELHHCIENDLEKYTHEHDEKILSLDNDKYSLLRLNDHTALLLRCSYVCHSTHRDPYEKKDITKRLFIGVGCRHCLSASTLKTLASALLYYDSFTTILSLNPDQDTEAFEEVPKSFPGADKLRSVVWKDWMSEPIPRLVSVDPELWTYDIRQRLEE